MGGELHILPLESFCRVRFIWWGDCADIFRDTFLGAVLQCWLVCTVCQCTCMFVCYCSCQMLCWHHVCTLTSLMLSKWVAVVKSLVLLCLMSLLWAVHIQQLYFTVLTRSN